MGFNWIDYIVFGASLIISAIIGISTRFYGGKQKTNEEYLVGNRRQNAILVSVSLMTSFMSAVSFLGGCSEAYSFGTHFFVINLGFFIGICLALLLYIPVFYDLKNFSVYTYLENRFGKTMCLVTSIAFAGQMIVYVCISLVAPAIALQTVSGISRESSIITVGLLCTLYSTLGGMKAVIFTDFFQAILMFSATISIIYSGFAQFGGFGNIIDIAYKGGRIDFTNFSLDPTIRHTWLSTIIGGAFSGLYLKGINQAQVQRYLTMKDYRTVVKSALLSWPLITALSFSICLCGLIAFAKYHDCDPIRTQRVPSPDQLLPLYVVETFEGNGLAGIFVSGIFAASLSTISPIFNSLAAVTLEDYIRPTVKKLRGSETEWHSSFLTQILVFIYGSVCVGLALLATKMQSILQASVTIFGVVGGPMLGLFTLGMISPIGNEKGGLVGFLCGIAVCCFITLGQPRPALTPLPARIDGCSFPVDANATMSHTRPATEFPFVFRISYMFYGLIGFTVTVGIGYLCSLILKDKKRRHVDSTLLFKPVAKMYRKRSSFSSNNLETELKNMTGNQSGKRTNISEK